jgi:ATP-binding cassette subfamily B protein/subfamily B ATP-binding cassette protein MsbA
MASGGSSKQQYQKYLKRRATESETPKALDTPSAKPDWTVDQPRGKRKASRPAGALLKAFWKLIRGRKWLILISLVTVTVQSVLGMLGAPITQFILDHVVGLGPSGTPGGKAMPRWWPDGWTTEPRTLLWWCGGVLIGAAIVSTLIGINGRYQMTRLTIYTRARLRRALFAHMAALPLHRIQAVKSGGVSGILREDAQSVGDMIFSVLYNPTKALVTFILGLTGMAVIDWRLLIGGLLLLPLVWFTHRTWISRIRPVWSSIKLTRQAGDAHATEVFSGMRVVRTFGRARAEAGRSAATNHLQARKEQLVWWWSRGIEMAWMLLVPAASAAVLVYGGNRILDGKLTIGALMAFSMYLLMLLGPMEVLVSTASGLQNSLAAWDRCLDILAEPREFDGAKTTAAEEDDTRRRFRGELDVREVSFTYPGATQEVLHNVSLHVPAGHTVALVGHSGSGKTTLCNLIARFYDPTHGSIALDGLDLRQLSADRYRSLLGIVEQDVFLFDGSIADNIAYGRRGATNEQVRAAAEAANAHGFITGFENGYETIIGERGVRLSGGQKQRIAIARAILADPRILILDEATSNLDTESERLIQRAMVELMKGRTCFVIAHRLSTIRHADLIVVLEHGKITETGTHDQLVAAGGRYLRMLQAQIDPLGTDRTLDKAQ